MLPKKLPLTGLPVGKVPPAVLVCGDPGRADRIAAHLQNAALLSELREYRCYRGTFQDVPVAVCSHGIGAPGAAIAFEELIQAGARRLIRVGTCGGLQPDIDSGDLILATAAVDHTGYGRETVPSGYPAAADLELAGALRWAGQSANRPLRSGVVLSRDNFYGGVDVPGNPNYGQLSRAHVLAVEMECAALFIVGALRQVQTAAILVADGNVLLAGESMESYRPHQSQVQEATEAAISIALNALTKNDHAAQ